MAKDYGRKRSAQNKSRSSNQFLLLLVAFIGGYLTATFFDPEQVNHLLRSKVLTDTSVKPQVAKGAHQPSQAAAKPKFEFYTLLTDEKVPAQTNSVVRNSNKTAQLAATNNQTMVAKASSSNSTQAAAVRVVEAKPIAAAAAKSIYSVQVASFKTRKDAEQMKGMLILKGYDVQVVAVNQTSGNWFRVIVGPYPNKLSAQQAQTTIAKTERLNGMITSSGV